MGCPCALGPAGLRVRSWKALWRRPLCLQGSCDRAVVRDRKESRIGYLCQDVENGEISINAYCLLPGLIQQRKWWPCYVCFEESKGAWWVSDPSHPPEKHLLEAGRPTPKRAEGGEGDRLPRWGVSSAVQVRDASPTSIAGRTADRQVDTHTVPRHSYGGGGGWRGTGSSAEPTVGEPALPWLPEDWQRMEGDGFEQVPWSS